MKYFSADHAVTSFGPVYQPIGEVALGERFSVETSDCYGGQVTSEAVTRPEIDMSGFNRATGPIRVGDVAAGDQVAIEVHDIQVRGPGVMAVSPGLGLLGDQVTAATTRLLDVHDERAWLTERVGIPLDPMIGILGIATSGETVPSSTPGDHGGNLDTKLIRAGVKVLVRAHQEGLGLAVGDLHAAMGDGEMGGTGIEVSGRVELSITRYPHRVRNPMILDSHGLHVVASAEDVTSAAASAMDEAVSLLADWHHLDWADAYRLTSVVADVQVSQLVNPRVTARVRVPLEWVDPKWLSH